MAGRGRPKGARNKINVSAPMFKEMLAARGVCIDQAGIELFINGDQEMKFRVWREWMRYVYAPRRPEDANGNPGPETLDASRLDRLERLLDNTP